MIIYSCDIMYINWSQKLQIISINVKYYHLIKHILIDTDVKILNKALTNRTQQYSKRIFQIKWDLFKEHEEYEDLFKEYEEY